VLQAGLRLRVAQKLGFGAAVTGRLGAGDRAPALAIAEHTELAELIGRIAAGGQRMAAE
jgi:DNA repair protein RadA/Sms